MCAARLAAQLSALKADQLAAPLSSQLAAEQAGSTCLENQLPLQHGKVEKRRRAAVAAKHSLVKKLTPPGDSAVISKSTIATRCLYQTAVQEGLKRRSPQIGDDGGWLHGNTPAPLVSNFSSRMGSNRFAVEPPTVSALFHAFPLASALHCGITILLLSL